MKTMKIEKELQFADQVKEPRSLQVRESLEYHKEAEGIRAVGPLRVQGSYVNDEGELQEYEEGIIGYGCTCTESQAVTGAFLS